jgi:hypothetical protein
MRGTRTFEVYKSTQFVGFIKARSHPAAVRRATGPLWHLRRRASRPLQERARDYRSANTCQQAKQSRRYPVGDFEARRNALIAEVLG